MEKINKEKLSNKFLEDIPLIKIGNFIKEARISRNQSTKELASDLKISEQQLKAIEEGREDLLPEKIFVKAMLKRISEKLKLDSNYIMSEFNNKTEEIRIDENTEENAKEIERKQFIPFPFLINVIISGSIGLLASTFIFNLFSDSKYESTSQIFMQNSIHN